MKFISQVTQTPTTSSEIAASHYLRKLQFETDPSDVYTDIKNDVVSVWLYIYYDVFFKFSCFAMLVNI